MTASPSPYESAPAIVPLLPLASEQIPADHLAEVIPLRVMIGMSHDTQGRPDPDVMYAEPPEQPLNDGFGQNGRVREVLHGGVFNNEDAASFLRNLCETVAAQRVKEAAELRALYSPAASLAVPQVEVELSAKPTGWRRLFGSSH